MGENKFLLIDDLAHKGWRSALELSVIKKSNTLDVALTYEDAIEKLKHDWTVIFLDMRLTEKDHHSTEYAQLSGFTILKNIKSDFTNINFATPIILFTASNKIWNVDLFNQYSIEGFYIKEHPNYFVSNIQSRKNLENLQDLFTNSLYINKRTKNIWKLCVDILKKLDNHDYFKGQDKRDVNIKARIKDKLKLGYGQLFKRTNQLEKEQLLNYNEALSFLVFWSILEELTKGYTDFNSTWNGNYERKGSWKFRNTEYFIERGKNKITLNFSRQKDGLKKDYKDYDEETEEYKEYIYLKDIKPINLSTQIYSLMSAYSINQKAFSDLILEFRNINDYRNEIDFIHSSVLNIFTKNLVEEESVIKAYDMNIKILEFINKLLELPFKS
jgi:hypothetical protein